MSGAVDHITFRDALDHAIDYTRGNPNALTARQARQAVLSAIREMGHNHTWSYFQFSGRLNLRAPFNTGTIAYDHTGGSYERLVTLTPDSTGATFPSWAAFGHLLINNVVYLVAERPNTTSLQLSVHANPGEDIAPGTSFTLYRDSYVLPVDYERSDRMYAENNLARIDYVEGDHYLFSREHRQSTGTPTIYTVKGSTDYQGCMEASFAPYPDQDLKVSFMYQRRPRKVAIEQYEVETVSVSAGSKNVTGDGTAFTDDMVGAIIRISTSTHDKPTSRVGDNVYEYERMIMRVTSATVIETDQNFPVSLSGVRYVISDPIDMDAGAMGTMFLRLLEYQAGTMARFSDRQQLQEAYLMQLRQAREADSRSSQHRSVGETPSFPRRLKDHQYGHGEDIE